MSLCNTSPTAGTRNKILQGKQDHRIKHLDIIRSDKIQCNSDQLKYSNVIGNRMMGKDDLAWQERIKQIVDLTCRTEEEVIMALYDCDGDLNQAVNDLLEGISPEWEVKKKKARPAGGTKQNCEQTSVSENTLNWEDKNYINNDGLNCSQDRSQHNRGWLCRENKENQRNADDYKHETSLNTSRKGRGITGRSGRGGRGSSRNLGPRTFANRRESSSSSHNHSFTRTIDTWTGNEERALWNIADTTEDWENEEYTGSLADTKVFTPSTLISEVDTIPDRTETEALHSSKPFSSLTLLTHKDSSNALETCLNNQNTGLQNQTCQQLVNIPSEHDCIIAEAKNLTTAQSKYFTHLRKQANDCLYVGSGQNLYLSAVNSQATRRQTKHRPRIPPPSKIPSSAVEMPGDTLNSSISFLDVQFGALEFGSDLNMNEGSNLDKYNTSGVKTIVSSIESNLVTTKTVTNSVNSQTSQAFLGHRFNTKKILQNDSQKTQHEKSVNSQSNFVGPSIAAHSTDLLKEDISGRISHEDSTSFKATVTYQSSKPSYATPITASDYNSYSCNVQSHQTSFSCSTSSCNANSYSNMVTQGGFTCSYTQSSMNTYDTSSPSPSTTSGIHTQTCTSSQQVFHAPLRFTTSTVSQYQSQSTVAAVSSNKTSFVGTGYPSSSSFQSSQSYPASSTAYVSSTSQGASIYSNNTQSVYANTYSSYESQKQTKSDSHKMSNDLQFDDNTTTASTALVTTETCKLGLTCSSVSSAQTKSALSNVMPNITASGLMSNCASSSGSIAGSGTTTNIAPVLSHQYIVGQSVPYATFQQPHVYSYEDLQLMQQRIPHMPTSGYYDASLGFPAPTPPTSHGSTRTDALSSTQAIQQASGQYTNINDVRFSRTDSSTSPVSSTMSQQTGTQHQPPLMNPIPPGYAYFYGGSIMPPSGFQYGTPAIYSQIATAGNAGTTNAVYNTKAGYSSGYGNGTNYDTLTVSSTCADYKSSAGYAGSQTSKSSPSSANTSTAGSVNDVNPTIFGKNHASLSKVNSYEKQAFQSATPPFSLTNNQNASVLSGYGATHLFIPTVPHQMHQPVHQETGTSSVQRTSTNLQTKAQVKPGYNASYWAGSN